MCEAPSAPRVRDVLHELYRDCEGVIELRAITLGAGVTARTFAPADDLVSIGTFWREHKADNLYLGVATRRDAHDGTLANCLHLPALFADVDFKTQPEADARAQLARCPLAPSLVVQSGGGLQPYWFLREPADVSREAEALRQMLRRLAGYLGADLAAAEPARVLRVPGTLNQKYDPPRLVRIETFQPGRRYNLSEFGEWLPAEPVTRAAQPIDLSRTIGECRNVELYRLARALKGKRLPDRMIAHTIETVNSDCCDPPLDAWEVRQVVQNALRQPDRPLPVARTFRVEVGR